MADVAGLISPRALFVESGTKDDIFPIAATRAAVADTRRNFATFGVPEKLGFEGFDGEHPFCGTGMFTFLGQRLWGVPCTLAIDGSGTAAYIQAIDPDEEE